MEKRYQVFISSTKLDLEAARSEVSRALLRAKCFPAQMENFNAVDEGQMDHIKRVIDQSDYFVLILGGMYGSIETESGKSYTQLEYEYAVAQSKPIIRLLRRDPFSTLTGDRIEQETDKRKKLEKFRSEVSAERLCRFWESEKELGAEVALALTDMKETHPAEGWLRANALSSTEAQLEIARLSQENAELALKLATPTLTPSYQALLNTIKGFETVKLVTSEDSFGWIEDISQEIIEVDANLSEVGLMICKILFRTLDETEIERQLPQMLLAEFTSSKREYAHFQSKGDSELVKIALQLLEGVGLVFSEVVERTEKDRIYFATVWKMRSEVRRWIASLPRDP